MKCARRDGSLRLSIGGALFPALRVVVAQLTSGVRSYAAAVQESAISATAHHTAILRPGETCWRLAHAGRMALIVDAADYFRHLRSAIMNARECVLLIGWDFDTRIELDPNCQDGEAPGRLGRFLSWIVEQRPELHIYVLKWDLGALKTLGRGTMPFTILDWMAHKRVHLKLDAAHPIGAAHHQKIAVIDDSIAFCGGIDITAARWDTPEHRDKDERRVLPMTRGLYGPWHDSTAAVDGDAARALGLLARDRWKAATGEEIAPARGNVELWPDGLAPTFRNIDVGIARTAPEYGSCKEVREIEALYLASIAAARRSVYIESQYFAARRISEAIAARLSEPNGPEFLIVNPESASGWLEEAVMGPARARLLRFIAASDKYRRFRMVTPFTQEGTPIYVHSKVLIVDDTLLRIGSSNLNNRSMGFDTECDLAVEAREGNDVLRRAIADFRNRLIAEHLGIEPHTVTEAIAGQNGSILQAVDALRCARLRDLSPPEAPCWEKPLRGEELLDPERPASVWAAIRRRTPDFSRAWHPPWRRTSPSV